MKKYFVINTQKDNYPLEEVDKTEFKYWLKHYTQYCMDKTGAVRNSDAIKFHEITEIYNPQGILIGSVTN